MVNKTRVQMAGKKRARKSRRHGAPNKDQTAGLSIFETCYRPYPNIKIICRENGERATEFAHKAAVGRFTSTGIPTLILFCDASCGPSTNGVGVTRGPGGAGVTWRDLDPNGGEGWHRRAYKLETCPWINHGEMMGIVEAAAIASEIIKEEELGETVVQIFTDSHGALYILNTAQWATPSSGDMETWASASQSDCILPYAWAIRDLLEKGLAGSNVEIHWLPRCTTP